MIVESLGNVTFVNGLMRVQTLGVNPAGKMSETGTIEIPGNKIGEVINLLATAAQGISDKIDSTNKDESETKKDKNSSKKKKEIII